MPNNLITLQQARDHLRSDSNDDDADLAMKIAAASESVLEYLGEAATFLDEVGSVPVGEDGAPVGVPARVQIATLQLVAYLYSERGGSMEHAVPSQFGYGYLPQGVTALLYGMRTPTVV